jgi:hypothetical protein
MTNHAKSVKANKKRLMIPNFAKPVSNPKKLGA